MKWYVKLTAQKFVSFLPSSIRRPINKGLTKYFGMSTKKISDGKIKSEIDRGLAVARFLTQNTEKEFSSFRILELGSGWHGSDLILFYLLGCDRIMTVDVIRLLDSQFLVRFIAGFEMNLQHISKESGVELTTIKHRYKRISNCLSWHDFLLVTGFEYCAPARLVDVTSEVKFDIFYSYSVLHRMKIGELNEVLKAAINLCADNFYSCHIIHHYDHNARHDIELNPIHYLKYSERRWNLLQTDLVNYQNRLRNKQFIEIFESNGFKIIASDVTHLPRALLDDLTLDSSFACLDKDNILIGRSFLLLGR